MRNEYFPNLPPLEYAGLKVPITSRRVSFGQAVARHKYHFRSLEDIEALGAENLVFGYTIPLREGIAKGPYSNLFVDRLPNFFEACFDARAQKLTDPVHGDFQAIAISYSEQLDVARRDGVDVEVEFLQVPESADFAYDPHVLGLSTAYTSAGALEKQISKSGWHQEEPPEGTTDVFDSFDNMAGQFEMAGNKISATMDGYSYKMQEVIDTVDMISDPSLWPIRLNATRQKAAAVDLSLAAGESTKKLLTWITPQELTISAIASRLNVTVADLLSVNPSIASSPTVTTNTPIRYYRVAQ